MSRKTKAEKIAQMSISDFSESFSSSSTNVSNSTEDNKSEIIKASTEVQVDYMNPFVIEIVYSKKHRSYSILVPNSSYLRRESNWALCRKCNRIVYTRTAKKFGVFSCIYFLILFLFCPFICIWLIPLLHSSCKDVHHKCRKCGKCIKVVSP